MPYTNEKTSNTIEDKNTKIQDLFPLWSSTQNIRTRQDTHRVCVIINKKCIQIKIMYVYIYIFFYFFSSAYQNETCIKPLDPYRKTHINTPLPIDILIPFSVCVRVLASVCVANKMCLCLCSSLYEYMN